MDASLENDVHGDTVSWYINITTKKGKTIKVKPTDDLNELHELAKSLKKHYVK